MRALLSTARSCAKPIFYQDLNKIKRLEFSHQVNAKYSKHSKVAQVAMLNENTRCFTSYTEKELAVWNPETNETLFKRCFSELNK